MSKIPLFYYHEILTSRIRFVYRHILAENETGKFCEEEETAEHIIRHCEGLGRIRFLQIGAGKPKVNSNITEPLSKLWGLINKIKTG